MKKTLFLIMVFIVMSSLSLAQEKKPLHAPNVLPGVEPEMLSPDYWAALNSDADDVIMTPEEIEEFNERNRNRKVEFRKITRKVLLLILTLSEMLFIKLTA